MTLEEIREQIRAQLNICSKEQLVEVLTEYVLCHALNGQVSPENIEQIEQVLNKYKIRGV